MKVGDVRKAAMRLPDVTEEPHHEMTSFRVRGKIFATVPPSGDRVHIFVPDLVDEAVAEGSGTVEPLWWGKKLSGVKVTLADADRRQVVDLLAEAWRRKAPKSLTGQAGRPSRSA